MNSDHWSSGIDGLESYETDDIDVDALVLYYRLHYGGNPLWQLVEDMQKQAMFWTNVIERLKAGDTPTSIRKRFGDDLGLVLRGIPNPNVTGALNRALDKVSKYRRAMVEFIRKHGGAFLEELSMEAGLTVGLGVQLGFPPAVVLSIEHTHGVVAQGRWGGQNQDS
jgi:hypothetical protein